MRDQGGNLLLSTVTIFFKDETESVFDDVLSVEFVQQDWVHLFKLDQMTTSFRTVDIRRIDTDTHSLKDNEPGKVLM